MMAKLGIRWTIGNVNPAGFDALRLSISGAWKLFGSEAAYVVYVNSVPDDTARQRVGDLPAPVEWRFTSRADFPTWFRFGSGMAEGTGWKLWPLRAFDCLPELALDNDVILWDLPEAVTRWLKNGNGCLIAEDVRPHFGCFAPMCGPAPRNSGIRGIAPNYPLENIVKELLAAAPPLETEGDEQGLQVACVQALGKPELVTAHQVTICSPFPPHVQNLGTCGSHFVGLNTRSFNWLYEGRNPAEITLEHWLKLKPAVAANIFGHDGQLH